MKDKIYTCIIGGGSSDPGILCDLLTAEGLSPSTYTDLESRKTTHRLYFSKKAEAVRCARKLEGLKSAWMSDFGIKFSGPRLQILKKEDWTESWKKSFKLLRISRNLTVKAPWMKFKAPAKKHIVIEIDPGMSFGTGQHPTTRFCLKMIERLRDSNICQSFLDVGCGSGILSIAAAKLGYSPVAAFDLDPLCITSTRENMAANGVAAKSYSHCMAELSSYRTSRKYDLVAANVLSPVLVKNRRRLKSFVKKGGHLILSGILEREYCELRKAFQEIGFHEIGSGTEKEWRSGAFRLSYPQAPSNS